MAGLKIRCISIKPYLEEQSDGNLVLGEFEGEIVSLTLNKIYDALEEDDEYYRVVDNTDDDYLYPKSMFEVVSF